MWARAAVLIAAAACSDPTLGKTRWASDLPDVISARPIVAIDPAGDVIVGSRINQTGSASAGWLSKLSSHDGTTMWTATYPGSDLYGGDIGRIAIDPSGAIVATGLLGVAKLGADGQLVWQR